MGSWVTLKLVGMVEDERVNERPRREARGLGRMTRPSLLRCLAALRGCDITAGVTVRRRDMSRLPPPTMRNRASDADNADNRS